MEAEDLMQWAPIARQSTLNDAGLLQSHLSLLFYWEFTPNEIVQYYSDVSSAVDLLMIVYNVALAGWWTSTLSKH